MVSTRRPQPSDDENSDEDEEDVIELLPDRFDAQGRPLDSSSTPRAGAGGHWHTRRGDFAYRSPRGGADGFNMHGQWGISGTDAEAVERIVRNVTGVLEGRGSWMGLIGGLLSGSLLQGLPGDDEDDTDGGGHGHSDRGGRKKHGEDVEREWDETDEESGHGRQRRRRKRKEDERGESSSRKWKEDHGGENKRARGREGDGYYDDYADDSYDDDKKRRRRRRREEYIWEGK